MNPSGSAAALHNARAVVTWLRLQDYLCDYRDSIIARCKQIGMLANALDRGAGQGPPGPYVVYANRSFSIVKLSITNTFIYIDAHGDCVISNISEDVHGCQGKRRRASGLGERNSINLFQTSNPARLAGTDLMQGLNDRHVCMLLVSISPSSCAFTICFC